MTKWRGVPGNKRKHTAMDDLEAWCDCEHRATITMCYRDDPCKCCLQHLINKIRTVLEGEV